MQMPRDREKVTNTMRMQVILNSWLSAAMKDPEVDDLPANFSSQNQVYSDHQEALNADLIASEPVNPMNPRSAATEPVKISYT